MTTPGTSPDSLLQGRGDGTVRGTEGSIPIPGAQGEGLGDSRYNGPSSSDTDGQSAERPHSVQGPRSPTAWAAAPRAWQLEVDGSMSHSGVSRLGVTEAAPEARWPGPRPQVAGGTAPTPTALISGQEFGVKLAAPRCSRPCRDSETEHATAWPGPSHPPTTSGLHQHVDTWVHSPGAWGPHRSWLPRQTRAQNRVLPRHEAPVLTPWSLGCPSPVEVSPHAPGRL